MKNNKTLDTLVQDIYEVIEVLNDDEAIDIPERMYEEFGRDMEDALRHWATPVDRPKNGLRMSNIGRPLRRLWYDLNTEQDKEQIDKLKGLINNKNYSEAIETVISSSMDRVITHQNNLFDRANDDGRGTQTERDRQALLDYLAKTDSTRVNIVQDYSNLTKIKENGVFESYTKLENKLSQYGIIVNPITDTSGKNILQLELINQRNGVRSLLFGNMTDNQILAALDGAFGAFARGIDYESVPLNMRIK